MGLIAGLPTIKHRVTFAPTGVSACMQRDGQQHNDDERT